MLSSPTEFWYVAFFSLLFEAIGFVLFLPLALFLSNLMLRRLELPWALALIGCLIGVVVVLPISDKPSLCELAVPAFCGAATALVWFVINRRSLGPSL
jgi:uncharacterized membrane protein YjfL (UPF0719 family)